MLKRTVLCLGVLLALGATASQAQTSVRVMLVNFSDRSISAGLTTGTPYSAVTMSDVGSLTRSNASYWSVPDMGAGTFTIMGMARSSVFGGGSTECSENINVGQDGTVPLSGITMLVSGDGSGLNCQIVTFP